MTNEELYDAAVKATTELFSDQSVSKGKCRENLQELIGEIQTMIDSLGEEEGE